LELIGSLVKLNGPAAPAHFNQFFYTVLELAALGVDISQEDQGLFLPVLMEPPAGTTKTQLNNLVLVALEKLALALGPCDVQVIYNSVQSKSVEGSSTAASPFQLNCVGTAWVVVAGEVRVWVEEVAVVGLVKVVVVVGGTWWDRW
jgi:hypothetical protein